MMKFNNVTSMQVPFGNRLETQETFGKGRSVARCPKPRNLISKLIKLQVRNFR